MWVIRKRRPSLLASVLMVVIVAGAVGAGVAVWTSSEETTSAPDAGQQELAKATTQIEDTPASAESGPPAEQVSAAQRAFIDPETGRITDTPSRAQRAAVRPPDAGSRNARGLRQQRLASGGVAVDLEGRFRTTLVATVNPDGSFTTRCLQHPDALEPHDHSHEPDVDEAVEDPS